MLIDAGETKYVEWKREYSATLLKTVSAFANYHDGRIIIGVSDSGEVVGVENAVQLRISIENAINDNISPRPYFEIQVHPYDTKLLLVIKIFKGSFTPYYYKGKAYQRLDTSTVEADRYELNRLILEGQNYSFEELASEQQALTFDYLEKKFRDAKKINSLNEDLLKSLELIKNTKYTNSAALLSDANPLENACVVLVKYSKSLMNIRDKVLLKNSSVVEQFDRCMDFYHKHISVQETIEGPYRQTVEEIPLVAYREAVANAIVHRDYMAKGDIKIEFFADRVEITSPGGLPPGISEEEYMDGRLSVMRNRVIADIFLRIQIIEKLATGIRRIKEYYAGATPPPQFDVKQNSIRVILPQKVPPAESHDTKPFHDISEDEKAILDFISVHGEITRLLAERELKKGKTHTAKIIKGLLAKGHILLVGKGKNTRYLLR
jgi:ATP-dependent DNA helicase RecG